MNPNQPIKKPDFTLLQDPLHNCSILTHKICENIRNSQPFQEVNGDPNKSHFVAKQLEEQINSLNAFYNSLETIATDLPGITPLEVNNQQPLSVFSTFIHEAAENPQKQQQFAEASDAVHYCNHLQLYSTYLLEQLNPLISKASSLFDAQSINPPMASPPRSLSKDFCTLFIEAVKKENIDKGLNGKNFKFIPKPLEMTVTRCIMELVLESKSHLKALILVNNGQIEYINLYGPNEKYSYIDDKKKVIDIFVRSKFEYYSNLTTFANNQLQLYSNQQGPRRKQEKFMENTVNDTRTICSILVRSNQMITQVCKICKKYLNNGLPPTALVNRNFIHPECRGSRE